jgi:hypothetical protein
MRAISIDSIFVDALYPFNFNLCFDIPIFHSLFRHSPQAADTTSPIEQLGKVFLQILIGRLIEPNESLYAIANNI